MADARVSVDPAAAIGEVDERIFGSFVEHMGRAVYGGLYEPGHPAAGRDGWRRDVLALTRELGVTIVRYPGGNFVSGYDWEDGVGPRRGRPVRRDLAWRSLEPNTVGTDEFLAWTRLAGVAPMLAVNLGTRGAAEARNLVEYCNAATGTRYSDWRASNGHAAPYGVGVWCLGNEMDGPWQIGHTTAEDYGRRALEAGTAMRRVDPSIELVACGSSGSAMPTFGTWEETVLDIAWDVTDFISLHAYYDPAAYEAVEDFLACSLDLERMIERVAVIADHVAERKGSRRRMGLSVDEWNVWHLAEHRAREERDQGLDFGRAPALAEDEQDVADALAVGGLLIALLRHADRVRIACLAQLVNVIPAIRTIDGGPAWRQTSFHVFADVARLGRGTALELDVDGPACRVAGVGEVPAIDAVAVHAAAEERLTIFAVNRIDRPLGLQVSLRDLGNLVTVEQRVLSDPDLAASNSADRPDRVVPRRVTGAVVGSGRLTATLPGRSWNVIRLSGVASSAALTGG